MLVTSRDEHPHGPLVGPPRHLSVIRRLPWGRGFLRHNGTVISEPNEAAVTSTLRAAGARFAFVHGSRSDGRSRPDSDLDVGAWWAADPPHSWELELSPNVDLVILNRAPLWLAGRIALHGRLLFDDSPKDRIAWQADTRRIWLDERPRILQSQEEFRAAVAARG